MNILGIIPARGGSKGIPGKNLAPLCGKPLIGWTFEAAQNSDLLTRVILSSDDSDIIAVAEQYQVEVPFLRPSELAEDDTPALPVIQHTVKMLEDDGYRPDIIVYLQPPSPLRTSRHIDEAVQRLIDSDADSVVSVEQVPHRFSPGSVMELHDGLLTPYMPMDESKNLRQLKPAFFGRNGAAIYAFTYDCLMKKQSIYGDRILPYVMLPEESVDIDDPIDLEFCEFLLHRRQNSAKVD